MSKNQRRPGHKGQNRSVNPGAGQPAPKQGETARERKIRVRIEAQQRAARKKRLTLVGALVVIALLLVGAGWFIFQNTAANSASSGSSSSGSSSSAAFTTSSISCDSSEMSGYHVHAHLSIYVNGKPVTVPAQIGITDTCLYWLHTHATDGIIHVEAPASHPFKLGQFLDIWGSKFSSLGYEPVLDQTSGWQAYVNGKLYQGDFRQIPLNAHTLITLAYQTPGVKPDTTYNWNGL